MATPRDNNRRIAKNTVYLYVRQLFGMFVSLYTSRVILKVLGVEDFGIYTIAGGFVGMMGFLNASLSGATSRFLTYELGKENSEKLRDTFCSALIIHVVLSLVVAFFCETVGLWFLENKMVIPAEKMFSARILFQFSVIAAMLGIMNTPFIACLTSHEKLNVFAMADVGIICLRLGGVLILQALDGNKLVTWGTITFALGIVSTFFYYTYCKYHFAEVQVHWVWKPSILKSMLSFSGWDLYGNASVMARTQGVNMLLNLFFGPLVNAAAGIATQVQGAMMGFGGNAITAFRPQIVKQYAAGNYSEMFSLFRGGLRITCLLLTVLMVPLMVELDFVLYLWLGIVPEYSTAICRITLLFNYFSGISLLLACVIHATGNMKRISLINGTLYLLVIPVSYVCFHSGAKYTWLPFLVNVLAIFLGIISNAWSVKLYIRSFSFGGFIWNDYMRSLAFFATVYALVYGSSMLMNEGWLRLVLSIIVSIVSCTMIGLWGLFNQTQRTAIINFCAGKLTKYKLLWISR